MTLYYSQDHEWIDLDGELGTVGITDYAQNALGDIVFVELPELGNDYSKGDEIAVVESVKAASEIYAPVSGEITAVNEALEEEPASVNANAQSDGWFFKIKLADHDELNGLMDKAAYQAFTAGLE